MQEEKGAVVARLRVPFRDLRILDPLVRIALFTKINFQSCQDAIRSALICNTASHTLPNSHLYTRACPCSKLAKRQGDHHSRFCLCHFCAEPQTSRSCHYSYSRQPLCQGADATSVSEDLKLERVCSSLYCDTVTALSAVMTAPILQGICPLTCRQ